MRRKYKIALLFVMILQYALLYINPIAVLEEVHYGKEIVYQSATQWIRSNPTNGITLLSDASLPLGFDAKIPTQKIISEANGKYWKNSLIKPQKYVTRIIMSREFDKNDIVWRKLNNSKNLKENYHLVFSKDHVTIYDLNNKSTKTSVSKNITNKPTITPTPKACYYSVKVGDNLWKIASRVYGNGESYEKLVELNKTATLPIRVNQKIIIPCAKAI